MTTNFLISVAFVKESLTVSLMMALLQVEI